MMDAKRARFISEVAKSVRLDAGEYTVEAIAKMTKHITEDQYSDFIVKISEGVEFARPLEIINTVSDKYLDEIKNELFKDVEADAKYLEKKLDHYFYKIEGMFSQSSSFYDIDKVKEFGTPSELIKTALIRINEYWNDKDVYLINKIGLRALYDAFNNPYRQVWTMLAEEMKNTITQKYLMPKSNMIENRVDAIKKLANKKGMR